MNLRIGIQGLNGLLPACRKALAWAGLLFAGVSPGAQSHPNVVSFSQTTWGTETSCLL